MGNPKRNGPAVLLSENDISNTLKAFLSTKAVSNQTENANEEST